MTVVSRAGSVLVGLRTSDEKKISHRGYCKNFTEVASNGAVGASFG